MTANEKTFRKLFSRTIHTNNEDIEELAADLLCSLIKKDANLIDSCTKQLISYMSSKDLHLAMKSLELLQECMLKCGPEFEEKVSKNKFLNHLVKLVSTKYEGNQTPQEVRNKIMDILLLWTTQYPKRENIKKAYTALCEEGIKHGPPSNMTSSANSLLNEGEEKILKKLLQSKDKGDIDKANLLIKFFVNQDNKKKNRKVLVPNRIQEIEGVLTMLNDLISNWIEKKNENNRENLCLMKEIYDMVSDQFKPELPLIIEMLDECEEELLAQTLEVNLRCLDVINRYDLEILHNATPLPNNEDQRNGKSEDILSEFLGEASNANLSLPQDPMQELEEIFTKTPENPPINVTSFTLLEPQLVNEEPKPSIDNLLDLTTSTSSLKDIDKISEELLKANISDGELVGKFKRTPKKLSLNELAKSIAESSAENECAEQCPTISLMDKLTNATAACEDIANSLLVMETPKENIVAAKTTNDCNTEEVRKSPDLQIEQQKKLENSPKESRVRHLAEIFLDLDQIIPSTIKPKTILNNEELQIIFNFAANKPSPDVSVIVISAINRSYLPLGNYQFDVSAGKRCKLRLLPPTSFSLPGTKPFKLPTVEILQILLLYNPTGKPIDITCIVGYTLGDDPDVIKESIFVKVPNFN